MNIFERLCLMILVITLILSICGYHAEKNEDNSPHIRKAWGAIGNWADVTFLVSLIAGILEIIWVRIP